MSHDHLDHYKQSFREGHNQAGFEINADGRPGDYSEFTEQIWRSFDELDVLEQQIKQRENAVVPGRQGKIQETFAKMREDLEAIGKLLLDPQTEPARMEKLRSKVQRLKELSKQTHLHMGLQGLNEQKDETELEIYSLAGLDRILDKVLDIIREQEGLVDDTVVGQIDTTTQTRLIEYRKNRPIKLQ